MSDIVRIEKSDISNFPYLYIDISNIELSIFIEISKFRYIEISTLFHADTERNLLCTWYQTSKSYRFCLDYQYRIEVDFRSMSNTIIVAVRCVQYPSSRPWCIARGVPTLASVALARWTSLNYCERCECKHQHVHI